MSNAIRASVKKLDDDVLKSGVGKVPRFTL